jgi:transcriptional regulator with XRE-family HTH domain
MALLSGFSRISTDAATPNLDPIMKNRDLDTAVGGRLALWMQLNNLVDSKLAKMVGAASPTVATWRNGTRPGPVWREKLSTLTGWDWNNPESIAALTDQQVGVEVAGTSDKTFVGLLVSRAKLEDLISNGAVDLTPALALIQDKLAELASQDAVFKSAVELSAMVNGKEHTRALIEFLRQHTDLNLDSPVERRAEG